MSLGAFLQESHRLLEEAGIAHALMGGAMPESESQANYPICGAIQRGEARQESAGQQNSMTPEEYFRFLDAFWTLFPDPGRGKKIIISNAKL